MCVCVCVCVCVAFRAELDVELGQTSCSEIQNLHLCSAYLSVCGWAFRCACGCQHVYMPVAQCCRCVKNMVSKQCVCVCVCTCVCVCLCVHVCVCVWMCTR